MQICSFPFLVCACVLYELGNGSIESKFKFDDDDGWAMMEAHTLPQQTEGRAPSIDSVERKGRELDRSTPMPTPKSDPPINQSNLDRLAYMPQPTD